MEPQTKRLLAITSVGLVLNLFGLVAFGWGFFDSPRSVALLLFNVGFLAWFGISWWSETSTERAMERYKQAGP